MTLEWKFNGAKEQLIFLTSLFGKSDTLAQQAGGSAKWTESLKDKKLFGLPICFSSYEVKDEEVYSLFPVEHFENQYASVIVNVEPATLEYLNNLSGSLFYDPNAGILTSRGATIYDNIITLYLALRVIENPARLRDMHNKKLYHRLMTGVYKVKGDQKVQNLKNGNATNVNKPLKKLNKELIENVYRGMCRVLKDMPAITKRGYWSGAFSSTGDAPTDEDGKYVGDRHDSIHRPLLESKKVKALENVAKRLKERQEKGDKEKRESEERTLTGTVWEPEHPDEATDGDEHHALLTDASKFKNGRTTNNSGESKDINLGLESLYLQGAGREVAIKSIEPFQGRFNNDINLGLSQLYTDAYNRPITITGVEPLTNGTYSPDEFERLESQESTKNWANQIAEAVQLAGTNGFNLRDGRRGMNAAEHYCGRRDYNPDIPPCRAHEGYPCNRGCSNCQSVKTYHTGLRPAESTDPVCIYGRADNPYIDASEYMRHYEDVVHDVDHYDRLNLY
ncbi:MAG: hypothetical protein E6R13_02000 [Spirochaetes bacterium]|nr:MAG: hypothetical protein E6R13_02000 [Spirochaetota bacterium]